MIRINIFNLLLSFVLISLYYNLNIFLYFINGISYLFDFNSRVNLNDSLINAFNFFWTSFTYLPIFFFTPLLLLILFSNIYNSSLLLMSLLFCYITYSFETIDFLTINYNPIIGNINNSNINLLLSNNLNKYHPFIFYFSTFILMILITIHFQFFMLNKLFLENFLLINNYKLAIYNFPLNSFALFLGSWWALQEGTWGGWWNWDASEVFGLLLSLYSISKLHLSWFILNNQQKFHYLVSTIFLIILVYFFIQLNFDLVSHNFGSRFYYFFNNNLFFLESILLTFFILLKLYYSNILLKAFDLLLTLKKQSYINLFKLYYTILILLIILFLLIITNSFLPLWNYFLWNYLTINNLNFNVIIDIFIISLSIILIQYFSTNKIMILLFILLINLKNLPSCILIIPFLINFINSRINAIHLALILFIISDVNSYLINFIQWYNLNFYISFTQHYTLLNFKQIVFICDTIFIEKSQVYTNTFFNHFNSWNTYFKFNACTLSSFLLYYDSSTFFNHFSILNNWTNTLLYIETNLINNLINNFFYFLFFIFFNYFILKLLLR